MAAAYLLEGGGDRDDEGDRQGPRRHEVLVNWIAPAVIETPLLAEMSEEHIGYMVAKIPMGRLGQRDEVAGLVCWLASEECSFSTGATYDISGGRAVY